MALKTKPLTPAAAKFKLRHFQPIHCLYAEMVDARST